MPRNGRKMMKTDQMALATPDISSLRMMSPKIVKINMIHTKKRKNHRIDHTTWTMLKSAARSNGVPFVRAARWCAQPVDIVALLTRDFKHLRRHSPARCGLLSATMMGYVSDHVRRAQRRSRAADVRWDAVGGTSSRCTGLGGVVPHRRGHVARGRCNAERVGRPAGTRHRRMGRGHRRDARR